MTIAIQTGDRTINAQEILPLLVNYQMLSRFVYESIIDQAIESIECTPEEVAIACSQLAQTYQLSTDKERQTWLARHCLNLKQFIALATRDLRIEKFKQANWSNEVQSHFLRRKQQLDRVIYSVILTQDLSIAQEIYFRIQEKEQSFSELARAYSQDSTAEIGGLVGPIELGNLPPSIAKRLSSSQENQVSL
jgi:parvulin-like peptidyl-prolyl isomerase